jgi:hypothetical protein
VRLPEAREGVRLPGAAVRAPEPARPAGLRERLVDLVKKFVASTVWWMHRGKKENIIFSSLLQARARRFRIGPSSPHHRE